MNQFRHLIAATLIATAAAQSAPAQTANREVSSITVDYSDLNLRSADGVAALRHRLSLASRRVCGQSDGRELAVTADVVACRGTAMTKAMAEMGRVVATAQTHGTATLALNAPN